METTLGDHDVDQEAEPGEPQPRRGGKARRGHTIPDVVIRRLPIYARALEHLHAEGIDHVSSEELGDRIDVSAAQIRRDLAYFGDFGKQGKGYGVEFLLAQIRGILQLQQDWNIAVVGLGDLGHALARYSGFRRSGFHIAALFDHNPRKAGQRVGDLTIQHMDALPAVVARDRIAIALLAVPASEAQDVADQLVQGGIRAILNYAPTVVKVPKHVSIRHIDPVVALQSMTYYLPNPDEE
ncbi:MAG TPA: redox-sensing transcriptional repressor Rex [Chloroflexia bacterium]|nr:redox-sensing transcriptional repressor Rex [Chloroflexia bacterium]